MLVLAVSPWANGQNDEPARPSYSRMLNIEALLDNHVRFLARRYNLSADQETYTQAFLHAKTDQFLERHREQLFDLVDRLVDVRAGAEMSPQELVAWGKLALPLYQEAKTLIIEGNNEWRMTLTEEQQKVHDDDLRDMYTSFTTTEDQLQRIVSGQMTLEEFRRGPGRNVPRLNPVPVPMSPGAAAPTKPGAAGASTVENAPPPAPKPTIPAAPPKSPPTPPAKPATPPQGTSPPPASGTQPPPPAADQTDARSSRAPRGDAAAPRSDAARAGRNAPAAPTKTGTGSDFESQWEAYVREFIQKYQLDEAQTQRANSILKDCQEQARRVFDKHKDDLERIDKKLQSLAETKEGPDKLKELNELNQQRAKLLAPIDEIFERQLKPRLDKLPTRAQRQAAEAAPKSPAMPPAGAEKGERKPGRGEPKPPVPPPPPPVQPPPAPEAPPPDHESSAQE
jgi:cell division septum initiation protein DivIVA